MTRPLILLLAVNLTLASCKKNSDPAAEPVPTRETVSGNNLIDYSPPGGAYTCRAPGEWKGMEDDSSGYPSVSFIGPLSAKGGAFISILQHTGTAHTPAPNAEKYAQSFWEMDPDFKQPEITKTTIGDNQVIRFHQERPFRQAHSNEIEYVLRYDYALIPVKDGFFELWHSSPVDNYQETLPVFESIIRSFKPKS